MAKSTKPKHFINGESLSIVIPAYNEEGALVKVVKQAAKDARLFFSKFEIIIIDDASTDETGSIADLLEKTSKNIRVIHHKKNQGFGTAFWNGIQSCKYSIITFLPADGQASIGDQESLFEKIKHADIVLGYRNSRSDYSPYRRVLSFGFLFLMRILFNIKFKDINWVHIYRKKVFDVVTVESRSVFILGELIVRAKKAGFRINEAPSIYHPREIGEAKNAKLRVVWKVFKDILSLRAGLYN